MRIIIVEDDAILSRGPAVDGAFSGVVLDIEFFHGAGLDLRAGLRHGNRRCRSCS